jgi:hypothetical protein
MNSGLGFKRSDAFPTATPAEGVVFLRPRSLLLLELTETKHLLIINNKG